MWCRRSDSHWIPISVHARATSYRLIVQFGTINSQVSSETRHICEQRGDRWGEPSQAYGKVATESLPGTRRPMGRIRSPPPQRCILMAGPSSQ